MSRLRILLADDHDLVRRGARTLLESQRDWKVVGEAAEAAEAVDKAKRLRPDVAVLDVSLGASSGFETARAIRESCPSVEIVILTMHESDQTVRDAIAAGARAYVAKSDAGNDLVSAVRAAARHQPFFSRRGAEILQDSFRRPAPAESPNIPEPSPDRQLTERQREVVKLLAEGKGNKEIAAALGISVKTAERHRANVMERLGLPSLSHIVRYAIRAGIISG